MESPPVDMYTKLRTDLLGNTALSSRGEEFCSFRWVHWKVAPSSRGEGAEVSDGSCVPKILMGSPDVGSVVTWGWVPLSLMDLRGEGPVQGSGETSLLRCFLFFLSVTRTCVRMYYVALARCLGKRCVLSRFLRDCWLEC